ncbi:hypothetical protein DUI87_21296 [Hirundo rustica rustica]|uniref:FAM69 protein-kinase domain-containing protein n=1 Tax=Hirundo rustica rustica TaxID=333673 RepID=A0A3M0JM61_HIRRU|nr:hypothetical protein DUI87_21296 [Hirundo rustica rustica]
MLRLVSLKLGRLYRYVKLAVLGSLAAALVLNTHSLLASLQRNELSERRFLQLNKCPACWGTSWCRKFLNGQLRLESWGRLRLLDFFNVKNVYFARYGEPREGSRRVVLKRLGSAQELADIDTKICRRATGRGRCDLLQALPATEFASLNGDVRLLTPGAVEGWSDLVHCPSQRLLDRLVRRYAETKDSGSFLLRNLKDSERMQLLITLAFNPEPLVLQAAVEAFPFPLSSASWHEVVMWYGSGSDPRELQPSKYQPCFPDDVQGIESFPSDEGWPFAKYLGACGRMVAVNYVGEELWSYFNAPWEKRVDLAWQLMEIAEQLTNNDFEFALYLLDVSFDNFAVGPRDGKVIIVDAENVLVADKRLIRQNKPENWDVWYESKFDDCDKEACLSFSKEILCARVTVDHNYYAICQNLLSRHATWRGTSGGLLHDPPAEIAKDGRLEALLDECANPKKRYGRFQAAKELREYLAQLSNNVR